MKYFIIIFLGERHYDELNNYNICKKSKLNIDKVHHYHNLALFEIIGCDQCQHNNT